MVAPVSANQQQTSYAYSCNNNHTAVAKPAGMAKNNKTAKCLVRKLSTKFKKKRTHINEDVKNDSNISSSSITNSSSSMENATLPSPSCSSCPNTSKSCATSSVPVNNVADKNDGPVVQIRIVPHLDDPSKSFIFRIINCKLISGKLLCFGRYSDIYINETRLSDNNTTLVHFQSKVVSRNHCEIYVDNDGKVFLRDTKSSTGTFLNHIKVGSEDEPKELQHNDIIQLGENFQNGTEEQYRAVKMKVDLSIVDPFVQQQKAFTFQTQTFDAFRRQLSQHQGYIKEINDLLATDEKKEEPSIVTNTVINANHKLSNISMTDLDECCICLADMVPCQSIFLSPCSHAFHFRCIRPLLKSYPGFQCPLCRTYSDLEDSMETEAIEESMKEEERKPTETLSTANPSSFFSYEGTNNIASSVSMTQPQQRQRSQTRTQSNNSRNPLLNKMKSIFFEKKRDEPIVL
ncbi:hypothetical protein BDF20DRAFT_845779 [Mycotypha africana]|uniref:uncharacterized protein n=1 Tax=Mycotypha africana TaxID=64632 RepID=UPI002301F0F0|nr:uncharacterized protein BDF20DRAFT_845779 [Mycotypha africana]KAI8991674.1 hypothetical protein BDF20DRAFT_845779 [Mycotypha africana]